MLRAFQVRSLKIRSGIRAGSPTGGAGGAAGGAGDGGDGGEGGEGEGAEAFTQAQTEAINKIVGSRVGEQLRKFQKDFSGQITKTIGDTITSSLGEIDKLVDGKIAALKPAGGEGAGGGTGTGGGGAVKVTETPEYKGLQKKLDDTHARITAAEQREQAAKDQAKATRLRQTVAEMLTKKGVDPSRVRLAVGQLIDVDKRVRLDGEGDAEQVVMKDGQDEVDFETGADAWLKSDEAKIYLPPRGSAGSGDRGGGRRATGTGQKKGAVSFEDIGGFVAGAFPSMTSGRPR